MVHQKIIFSILFLLVYSLGAQTTNESKAEFINAYKNVCVWMLNTESYSFQVNYASYLDHTSKAPFETDRGFYKKTGKNFVSEVMGIRTVQNSKMKLLIDTAEKLITLTNPQIINLAGINTTELESLLDNGNIITKKVIDKSIAYKIKFKNNIVYDGYEIKISSNGMLEQLTYYYSEQIEKDYDEKIEGVEKKVKPRLEIYFKNYSVGIKANEAEYSEQNYVLANQEKVKASAKYKNYQVKDYRFRTQ